MNQDPDLLVSGINDGQNLGVAISNISGTVGAARQAAMADIPAVAASQGLAVPTPSPGVPPDFPSGAAALMSWVHEFLLGRAGPPLFEQVVSINIPTCAAGSIRGTLVLPLSDIVALDPANCLSTVTDPTDDIAGFLNGFVTRTSVGTEGSIT